MLKQRIATATVLGSLVVGLALFLPVSSFAIVFGGILLLSGWEWAALAGCATQRMRALYSGLLLIVLTALWPIADHPTWTIVFLIPVVLSWCGALIGLWLFTQRPQHAFSPTTTRLCGIIFLLGFWVGLLGLRTQFGIDDVLFLLVLIGVADSAAYFTGRRFGRHKLAPAISPGKTWEGVWGALVATIVLSLIGAVVLQRGHQYNLWFITLCIVTVTFSIIGDLFESMIKRQCGVKDSGALLPGHGGMLDRIDGLIAAAPVFLLGLHGMRT